MAATKKAGKKAVKRARPAYRRILLKLSGELQQDPSVCRPGSFHGFLPSFLRRRHESPFVRSKIPGIVTNYLRPRTSRTLERGRVAAALQTKRAPQSNWDALEACHRRARSVSKHAYALR